MIHVTITPTSLSAVGHAGYNPGNDIVCAAVSTLIQTFEAAAREFTTDAVESIMKDGNAVIAWPRAPTKELSLLIDSVFLGLCHMAESYPDNIEITGTR